MIIKIHQGQPWLAVRIVSQGSNQVQVVDWENLRLAILPPDCPRQDIPLSPIHFSGCWPGHDIERYNRSFILPEDRPMLIYPAFKTDDTGAVVFRLDRKIWERPGRYTGLVETLQGRPVVALDLDVDTQAYIVESVSVVTEGCAP